MATATTPTLGGVSLPMPEEQPVEQEFRGGSLQMADGSIVIDLVDTTARHQFHLKWRLLTATELGTVQMQWAAIKNTTATYVSVQNTSHTVTQAPGSRLKWTPIVIAQGELAFDAECDLIEDS